jgi:hypothetical protein
MNGERQLLDWVEMSQASGILNGSQPIRFYAKMGPQADLPNAYLTSDGVPAGSPLI